MIYKLLSSKNWLPYFKPLAKKFNDNDPAILLSELANQYEMYSDAGQLTDDGYFYATAEKLEEETCLSTYKQAQAIKKLEEAGLIETKLKGIPAKKHFRFPDDFENKFSNFLKTGSEKTSKQEGEKFESSINKEIQEDKTKKESESAQAFSLKTDEPVNAESTLPPDEQRIEDACNRVYEYFRKYEGLVDKCREQAKNHLLTKKQIQEEIKKWVRYHSSEFHFLANIEKNVSKSFLMWMSNVQQFAPKQQQQAQHTEKQIYVRPNRRHIEQTPLNNMLASAAQKLAV